MMWHVSTGVSGALPGQCQGHVTVCARDMSHVTGLQSLCGTASWRRTCVVASQLQMRVQGGWQPQEGQCAAVCVS